ncbi:hypothetical protein BX283_0273 [Streptomyces sp. TLI_146]|nr:hypothetical protein BX283_0273 [Streptomyces sp. TLI_146]
MAPVVRAIDRTLEFLDLVGTCHKFMASTNRLVPLFRGRELPPDTREIIEQNLSRVRAACDRTESEKAVRARRGAIRRRSPEGRTGRGKAQVPPR